MARKKIEQNLLLALHDAMVSQAKAIGLETISRPAALQSPRQRSKTVLRELTGQISEPRDFSMGDLESLYVDHHAILIAPLPVAPSSNGVDECLARWINHSAIALTDVPAEYRNDLNLILVGPLGSAQNQSWREVMMRVERDEAVCRKMVWLPDSAAKLTTSAEEFCERTFLARPWRTLRHSAVSPVIDPLGTMAAGDALAEEWLALINSQSDEIDDLVKSLVESFRKTQPS